MNLKHRREYATQGRLIAAILLAGALASLQSANAQNSYSQQYQMAPGQVQPLAARTQFNAIPNQQPGMPVQGQSQVLSVPQRTNKKGHPLLHKLGHAAGEVGSAALSTANTAARVGMATGMMYAMYGRGPYGYGYGYNPLMYGRW